MRKRGLLIGGAIGLLLAAVFIGAAHAGTYPCPDQGTFKGVRIWCQHDISIEGQGRTYFRSAAYTEAATAIDMVGGRTFASREYCGVSIRANVNHGGWARWSASSAVITGGMTFGPPCPYQAAGTAARHEWRIGQDTRLSDWDKAKELR